MDNFAGQTEFNVALVLGLFAFIIFIRKYTQWTRKINLDEYNEKHKKKFKTYEDLQKHLDKEKERQIKKTHSNAKFLDDRLSSNSLLRSTLEKANKKVAKVVRSEPSEGSLTGKIARLKKLYKSGTLTKAEFEKAKNKLLK